MPKIKVGDTFGSLTVESLGVEGDLCALVRCGCGRAVRVRKAKLGKGRTTRRKTCSGDRSSIIISGVTITVGDTFGQLTVTDVNTEQGSWRKRVAVRCSCGWKGVMDAYSLPRTKRCQKCNSQHGIKAAHKAKVETAARKRGDIPEATWWKSYHAACQAIYRCYNPKNCNYQQYGARGITVCDEWRNDRDAFTRFLCGLPGAGDPSLSLHRIDNDIGYYPGNVCWVDIVTQNNERTSNRKHRHCKVNYEGIIMTRQQVIDIAFKSTFGCLEVEFMRTYRINEPTSSATPEGS